MNRKLTPWQLDQLRLYAAIHFAYQPRKRGLKIAKLTALENFLKKISAPIHAKHAEALFRQWRIGRIEIVIPKNLKPSARRH